MSRDHPVLVALHWLLAVMIIGGLVMGGQVLAETPNDDPFKLFSLRMHLGMGLAILALMITCLVVRLATARPPEADIGHAVLNRLGGWTHWVMYLVVFGVCGSGLAIANMAGLPAIVFGGSGDPLPATFHDLPPRAAHGALTFLLGALILAHAGAALYHQFVRKDGLFSRMWFGKREGWEMQKLVSFLNEIGGIPYVGGIASHIVIGATVGLPDPETAVTVLTYKELSAYILILPGLALKVLCDAILWFAYGERSHWFKIKLACMAFLSVNAFVFLVPMMPELRVLAEASVPAGVLSEAFHTLEAREALIGMSNALPLVLELVMGGFKPRLFGERRAA